MICASQLEFSACARYTGKSRRQIGRGAIRLNHARWHAIAPRRTVPRLGAPGHHGRHWPRTGAPAGRESALA
ncbi:conserved hypothetical protein [Cupriavidus taiwanensis]|nr:conserved hypothetical protein [Cupriavidus taiwanensis]